MSIPQVLHSGFSAVNNTSNNDGFNEAMSGKFKDKASENEFKNIYSKVAAINRGTLEPTDTQFYFKQPEINKLIKHKQFDFSKVEEGEPFKTKAGKFRTFHYK